MTKTPDAGYDAPEEAEQQKPVRFRLEKHESMFVQKGFACRLLRNEEPIGMIRAESEADFLWLKRRLDGTFDPENPHDQH